MENKLTSKKYIYQQRFGYGLGDFACNLIWQVLSLYLLFFYTDVMKLDTKKVAVMFVVCRVIDAISNIIIGFGIDKTNSKWGKNRPWILFGAVPFAMISFLAFFAPDISPAGRLVYAYVTYVLLSIVYNIVNLPLSSILPSMTNDIDERTVLATWRKFFAFLGSTIVSALFLDMVKRIGHGNDGLGFRIVMGFLGVIGCIFLLITFALVRENNLYESEKKATVKDTIKSLATNTPWKIFGINILFMWTGYFIQSAALIYYYKYYIKSTSLSALVATIMTFVPMMVNLGVPALAKKFGKRNLYSISSIIQLVGLFIIGIGELNRNIILSGAFISAIGYGIKDSIYFSMQADPVDYGEWKTGIQAAGTLSAINGFIGKVALALAGGISTFLLAWGGYNADAAIQTQKTLVVIKAMYLYLPMFLIICSIITMAFYKLDKQMPNIQSDLEKRRQKEI